MHDPVCHCNQLYLDYNSRPSKLVSTSVTLASFIQLRDVVCVSYTHTAFLSNHTEYREVVGYCYFFIGYIFFYMTYHASHNISEYIIL